MAHGTFLRQNLRMTAELEAIARRYRADIELCRQAAQALWEGRATTAEMCAKDGYRDTTADSLTYLLETLDRLEEDFRKLAEGR